MYTIVSAYGIEKTLDAQWKSFDIGAMTPAQVSNIFRKLYITLTASALPAPFHIEFDSISPTIGYMSDTMQEIMANFGNAAIPHVDLPDYKAERVTFGECFRLGYSVNCAKPGSHYTSKALPGEKTELQLSRADVNMEDFSKYCMVSSNGYLYMHNYANKIVYVPEAGYSLSHSKRNTVGFLSFEKIGQIKQYRITPEMVSVPEGGKIADKCYIRIPDEIDLTGKSLMVVIAGHLYFLDKVCSRISDRSVRVRTELIPILERYLDSYGVMDYTGLGLTEGAPDRLILEEFFSNAVMKKYVGHAQSFFVVVDTNRISYSRQFIKQLPLPGRFISRQEPKAPLVVGRNRFAEYWWVEEEGEWLVCVTDPWIGNRNYNSMPYMSDNPAVGPSNVPYRIYYDSRAHFLDIVADVEK